VQKVVVGGDVGTGTVALGGAVGGKGVGVDCGKRAHCLPEPQGLYPPDVCMPSAMIKLV